VPSILWRFSLWEHCREIVDCWTFKLHISSVLRGFSVKSVTEIVHNQSFCAKCTYTQVWVPAWEFAKQVVVCVGGYICGVWSKAVAVNGFWFFDVQSSALHSRKEKNAQYRMTVKSLGTVALSPTRAKSGVCLPQLILHCSYGPERSENLKVPGCKSYKHAEKNWAVQSFPARFARRLFVPPYLCFFHCACVSNVIASDWKQTSVFRMNKLVRENNSFCPGKSGKGQGKWTLQSSRNHVLVPCRFYDWCQSSGFVITSALE